MFNLIVSFRGGQGFTVYSVVFLCALLITVLVLGFNTQKDGETLNQALVNADLALYASKHTGKDRFTFHAPSSPE